MEKKAVHTGVSASVRTVVICGMFAAITAVVSQISVPIGDVPITCSLIAVYLSGLLLTPKRALLSQLVYLLLGAVGVPVYAGFQAGVSRLVGPTGGFLIIFPVVAWMVSLFMVLYDKKLEDKPAALRAVYLFAAQLASLLVCYAVGAVWYMLYAKISFTASLWLTVIPFVAGDIAKIVLCTGIALAARTQLQKVLLRK